VENCFGREPIPNQSTAQTSVIDANGTEIIGSELVGELIQLSL
jgi:hypothetical protein